MGSNVVNAINLINLPFGDDTDHLFMVILLMFYDIGFATSIWLVGNDYRYPGIRCWIAMGIWIPRDIPIYAYLSIHLI